MSNGLEYFHWGPCLVKSKVSDEDMKLVDEIYERAELNKDTFIHYIKKMKEEYYITKNDLPVIGNILENHANEYLHFLTKGYSNLNLPYTKKRLVDCWINNQRRGEFRSPHIHSWDLSFVLYVDIPNELEEEYSRAESEIETPGGICFVYNFDMMANTKKVPPNFKHVFFPRRGDLYIFPSSLVHFSLTFGSDCVRKSIAGNFEIE